MVTHNFLTKAICFFKMYQQPLKNLRSKPGVVLICIHSLNTTFPWNYFTLMSLITLSQEQT